MYKNQNLLKFPLQRDRGIKNVTNSGHCLLYYYYYYFARIAGKTGKIAYSSCFKTNNTSKSSIK